jgi:hypothetical protein
LGISWGFDGDFMVILGFDGDFMVILGFHGDFVGFTHSLTVPFIQWP